MRCPRYCSAALVMAYLWKSRMRQTALSQRSEGMERLLSGTQAVSFAGLEFYGPIERVITSEMVNRFVFRAAEKHADRLGKIARGVLAAFAQGVFEASVWNSEAAAEIVSMVCDFVGDARAGDRIEAEVRVVRRTTSLIFLTADITENGRILLTANALARRS